MYITNLAAKVVKLIGLENIVNKMLAGVFVFYLYFALKRQRRTTKIVLSGVVVV